MLFFSKSIKLSFSNRPELHDCLCQFLLHSENSWSIQLWNKDSGIHDRAHLAGKIASYFSGFNTSLDKRSWAALYGVSKREFGMLLLALTSRSVEIGRTRQFGCNMTRQCTWPAGGGALLWDLLVLFLSCWHIASICSPPWELKGHSKDCSSGSGLATCSSGLQKNFSLAEVKASLSSLLCFQSDLPSVGLVKLPGKNNSNHSVSLKWRVHRKEVQSFVPKGSVVTVCCCEVTRWVKSNLSSSETSTTLDFQFN